MSLRTITSLLVVVSLAAAAYPAGPLHAEPLTTSRLSWVVNGPVHAVAVLGDRLFIGGIFTRVAPRSAALGSLFALSQTTGAVVPPLPLADGEVFDIEADGAGGFYIGGRFSTVGGVARPNLARVRADGTVDPTFSPSVSARVFSIARGTTRLFVTTGSSILAFEPSTGSAIPYVANAFPAKLLIDGSRLLALYPGRAIALDQASGNTIWDISVDAVGSEFDAVIAGTRLFIGSRYYVNPGVPMPSFKALIAIDLTTGAVDATWPTIAIPIEAAVDALAVVGTTLYVGGSFASFGGVARTNLAAVDVTTGAVTSWAPVTDGAVSAMAATAGGIVAGGEFSVAGGAARERLAEFDIAGALTAWTSGAYPWSVHTLHAASGGRVLVGGRVAVNGGVARANLAAFDLGSDTVAAWAPVAADQVVALEARANSVFVNTLHVAQSAGTWTLSAVSADTGAPLPWAVTPSVTSPQLLAATDDHVYVTASDGPTAGVRRADVHTGALDPGWLAPSASSADIADGVMYLGGGTVSGGTTALRSVDVESGTVSPFGPTIGIGGFPEPLYINVVDLAVDGSTVNTALANNFIYGFGAFDAGSSASVQGNFTAAGTLGRVGDDLSMAMADGQVIVAKSAGGYGEGLSAGAPGQPLWRPGLTAFPFAQFSVQRTRVVVTPTDVIVVGLEGGAPSDYVQGVGVFARQPAVAPHNLKWSAVGNIVTFSWSAPGIAPAGYVLEVGSQPGATNLLALPIGAGATSFTAAAPNGTFFVRVRAAGAVGAAAVPSNEVAAVIGCAAPPPPPTALSAELAGPVVTLRWNAPVFATPTGYVLEAGSASGAANIANVGLGPDTTAFSASAPPGTYYVRVRAANGCGQSVPSAEVFVTVGTGQELPGAAGPLSATVSATFPPNVAVQWPAVPNAVGYVVEVGSAPRRANILTVRTAAPGLFAPTVPRGVYYLRVRAISAAGVGPPSPDHVVVVP